MASSNAKWLQVQLMLRDGVSLEYAMATLVDFTPMWALQMVHARYLDDKQNNKSKAYDNRTEGEQSA